MNAKEYLKGISKLDSRIRNKKIDLEGWRSVATSTGSMNEGERVQSSGSGNKIENAVIKIIECEEAINTMIERKASAQKLIESLNDEQYDLLHCVYFQDMTLKEYASLVKRSYPSMTTLHSEALGSVQEKLDERSTKHGER